jgi:pimeloyl-ACP methyl ester carboxylesterase/DNA-binding CsgD family transcriptional regulator
MIAGHRVQVSMSHPAEQIRFCTSRDGARIAYSVGGKGPPLIWIQHWVHHLKFDQDHPVWGPWVATLTGRNTVVRYDCRGCGLSDRERIEFSFGTLTDDFEAVVAAAGLDRFAILSMGGCNSGIAATFAARHPERVSHLILCESSAFGRLAGNPTPAQIEEEETRYKAIALGWPNENPAYGRFFSSMHIPDATPEQAIAYNELLRLTTTPANTAGLIRTFVRSDVRDIAPAVRCPTLIFHSRKDAVISFEEGRLFASLIKGARFVPLESRNHVLLGNEPAWQQFIAALDDFMPATPTKMIQAGAIALDELTARENEVLELLAQGCDNDTIAGQLGISAKTVRNQVSTIFSKLEVNSRAKAIVRAREAGFGQKQLG